MKLQKIKELFRKKKSFQNKRKREKAEQVSELAGWLAGEGEMEGTVAANRQYQPPVDEVKIWVCWFVHSWFCVA